MRYHRFYVSEGVFEGNKKGGLAETLETGESVRIRDRSLEHQLFSVFRFKSGQEIILFDGDGFEYIAVIKDKDAIKLLDKKTNLIKPNRDIVLCQAIIKKDNFEYIVQKTTEIGISGIVPILSERSEKKDLNMERLRKISIESSEQSGRGIIPSISPIVSFHNFFINSSSFTVAFHLEGDAFHSLEAEKSLKNKGPINIMVGPEGGWSIGELDMLQKRGIKILSLGQQTLRAETAAVSACALFLLS